MKAPVCFVVGEGLLALETVRALLKNGFAVLGTLSEDAALADYCGQHAITRYTERPAFVAAMAERGLDLLFSVNNSWIIPAHVLALPRSAAINFHDSILPRYGGLFATSWALINGESRHGITWHVMRPGIDTGEVLVQRTVEVLADDTAHTLNARCFEAATAGLLELLPMLQTGTVHGRPQPTGQGSYHGLGDRPWASGLLDFSRDARSLARLVRALDFGSIMNPFASAKCALAGELFIVGRAQLQTSQDSGLGAGLCIACSDAGLAVQTADGVLVLQELRNLLGQRVDIEACARRLNIAVGKPLSHINQPDAQRLDERFRSLARREPFWTRQLAVPRLQTRTLPSCARRLAPTDWPLTHFARTLAGAESSCKLTAGGLVAAFATRLSAGGVVELGLGVAGLSGLDAACFARVVPLRLGGDGSMREQLAMYQQTREQLTKHGSYARDLVARTPALRQHGEAHYELSIFDAEEPGDDAATDAAFVLHDPTQPRLVSYTQLGEGQLDAIDRALAAFAEAALAQPDAPVAELPLLDDSQRRTIVYDWNTTAVDFPRTATLPELFSAQARRTPQASAVRHAERSLSYQDLDERSSTLAVWLRGAGVVPGARVLVSLPHGAELVIAFLGIMKARASYVPVDPDAPAGRRETILATATPAMTICEPAAHQLWTAHTPCLSLDMLAPPAPRSLDSFEPNTDDVACVIFTSGSTGVPKGVEVLQRGLLNHALAVSRLYQLSPGDRVLCTASIGFDLCGEQIYPALLAGAEVIMRPGDLFDSLTRFEDFVRGAEITTLILPAGFWHEWMHALETASPRLPPSLRVVAVGAEKVLARHVRTFDRITQGKVRLFQGYGPTEATITCTMYQHTPGALLEGEDMPIGRPLANVQMYVLDAGLQPVPVGIVGDLYVAGDGLARGYLAAPALTAERFVSNPFVTGTCMYKTGDRARYKEDGQLVFLGREDSQIKLRGFRVELAEIEAVLAGCPGVSECVVLLAQPDGAPARLVAYVVRGSSAPELTTAALRSHLEQRLPAYMVPGDWLFLAALPRTLNQKIDKSALPELPVVSDSGHARAAQTPLEQSLCALVGELFPGRSVLPDDDFFRDLGGDSLLAIRLIGRIEAAHMLPLALSDFARDATVRAVSKQLTGAVTVTPPADYVTIQAGAPEKRIPLWLLPAVGGHVLYGEQLRRSMDEGQPVFGIEAPGLRESEQPLASIEDMASAYLRTILRVQPCGPYVIAGPSLGGLAAWQIASLLAQQGKARVVVVLLDTWGPGYPRVVGPLTRLHDQAEHILRQPSLSALWSLVRDRLDSRIREWSGVPPYTVADDIEGARGERIREVVRCSQMASEAYSPPPLAGQVVLFRATQNGHSSGVRFDKGDNGWGALSSENSLRIVPIATHHVELSDRPPAVIGELLQKLLDELARESFAAPLAQTHNQWIQSQVHEYLAPVALVQPQAK